MAERKGRGHVFISYVREDVGYVDQLQAALEGAGIPVWRDVKDIWPGEVWKRRLRDEIAQNSLVFMPCFSSSLSKRARSTMYEELTWAAEEYRKRNPDVPWIFPVLFEECDVPTIDLGSGLTLRDLQWIHLAGNQEQQLERLISALQRLVGVSSSLEDADDYSVGPGEGGSQNSGIVKMPAPTQTYMLRQERLVADALRAAYSITDDTVRAQALVAIARAVEVIDPERAARITADALRVAQLVLDELSKRMPISIEDERSSQSPLDEAREHARLAEFSGSMAARDPALAEGFAQSITDEDWKPWVLLQIAEAVAAKDPARAECITLSITNRDQYGTLLARIARAVAAVDPARAETLINDAERAARSTSRHESQALALAQIARAVAGVDPARAERLTTDAERAAQSITNGRQRAIALAEVAGAVAAVDGDRAERIIIGAERVAYSITDERSKEWTLAEVAGRMAAIDPHRAEQIAQVIVDESRKAFALRAVVSAVVATDADHAERVARSITDAHWKAISLVRVAEAIAASAPARAERLTIDAEHVAQSITDDESKEIVLAGIVTALVVIHQHDRTPAD